VINNLVTGPYSLTANTNRIHSLSDTLHDLEKSVLCTTQ